MTDGREHYYLGLPAWAFPGRKERYFTDAPSRLASYATVFTTVEGNTTFYRVPEPDTVIRWRDAVAGRPFRFCFKLPREITHERHPDLALLARFLDVISPLADNLGPLHEKPDVPVLQTVYNDIALVRLILHPDPASNEPWLDSWARQVADYLQAGIRTHRMIHCPNNLHCPPLAQRFHEKLRRQLPALAPLPPWPVPQQRDLL